MKNFVLFCFLVAGFWVGFLGRAYYDETVKLRKIDAFWSRAKAAEESCDETRHQLAVSMYRYVQEVICR